MGKHHKSDRRIINSIRKFKRYGIYPYLVGIGATLIIISAWTSLLIWVLSQI